MSSRVRQIVREKQVSKRCTIKQKYGVIVPDLRYYRSQHLLVDLRFRKEVNALPLSDRLVQGDRALAAEL